MQEPLQWEYCQLDNNTLFFYRTQERTSFASNFEAQTKAIAQLGAEGWELVTVWGEAEAFRTFYFKRPLENQAS